MSKVFTADELDTLASQPARFTADELSALAKTVPVASPPKPVPPKLTPKSAVSLYEKTGVGKAIGAASTVFDTVYGPLKAHQEALAVERGRVGRISPTRRVSYIAEETVDAAVNKAASIAGEIFLDPINLLPFGTLLGRARPVIRLAADALFAGIQQVGAVKALREGRYDDAALQQAFALVPFIGRLSAQKQLAILDEAKKRPAPRTEQQIKSDVGRVQKIAKEPMSQAQRRATTTVPETAVPEDPTIRFTEAELEALTRPESTSTAPATLASTEQKAATMAVSEKGSLVEPGQEAAPQPAAGLTVKKARIDADAIGPVSVVSDKPKPTPKTYAEAQTLMDSFDNQLVYKYGKDAPSEFIYALTNDQLGIPKTEASVRQPKYDFTTSELAEYRRLEKQRDAFDIAEVEANVKDIDKQFEPLITDATKRRAFVRTIAEADLPTALRSQYSAEPWRAAGDVANKIAHYVSENVTKDAAETAFNIKAKLGGTPDNPGIQLQMVAEHGLGPSNKTLVETQRWLNHLFPENTPLVPGIKSSKKPETTPPAEKAEAPITTTELLIRDGADAEMQAWAQSVRDVQQQLKRGESAQTVESNVFGKEVEETQTARATSIRSLGVKEGSPLAKFSETPGVLAAAIEKKSGKLYGQIRDTFRETYADAHKEKIQAYWESANETQRRSLLGEDYINIVGGEGKPLLARTAQEAATMAAAGQRPELLKEGKAFDETRLAESELFAGRGGRQEFLSIDERADDFAFGANIGEPSSGTRPQLPTQATAAVRSGDLIAKSQILRDLSQRLNVPLRVGRFRERAWGIFKVKPEVVRTRIANDVATAAHEFGHAINKIIWGTRQGKSKNVTLNWKPFAPFRGELAAIATKPRAGQSPLPEGFAEFLRMYLTDPAQAQTKAPKFYSFFTSELGRFPDLRDTLTTSQRDIAQYINQSPGMKIESLIRRNDPPAVSDRWRRFYADWVDRLDPINDFMEFYTKAKNRAKGSVTATQDAYKAARLYAGWVAKADRFLVRDTFDPVTNTKTGESLQTVLKPVASDLRRFEAFLIARRAVEKNSQGIKTGVDLAEAKAVIADASPVFQQTAERMYAYQDALLSYLEKRGIYSKEQISLVKEANKDYIPFYRAFDEVFLKGRSESGTGGGFGNVAEALKRMWGSERDILPPVESVVKNTYALINLAERNNVARLLVDRAAEVHGSGIFIERVPQKMRKTTFALERIKKDLEAAGVDTAEINLAQLASIFEPMVEKGGRDNILSVVRNGKREYYSVNPEGGELYRALQGLDQSGTELLVRALGAPITAMLTGPAKMLRAGATALSPEFSLVRNPFRDALTASMQTTYGLRPGAPTVRGIFHAVMRDELYWEWRTAGGDHATMVSLDRKHLQKSVRDLLDNRMKYVVRHPIEALKIFGEFGEAGTRIAEFEKARRQGASLEDAALASRNVTIDFARMGARVQALNSITAFFNSTVQGMDQFARLHKEHPTRSLIRGTAGLTVPTLLLFALNKDNEKYNELPRWRRDFFWNIPTDGTPLEEYTPFVPVPKPFEWGTVYATIPERIAEWIHTKDTTAFDDLLKNFAEASTPSIIPTAFLVPVEAFANRSTFTGRPIVPMSVQRLEPEQQFQYYTSEFSKAAARTLTGIHRKTGVDLRVSPMQLDNAIYGYSGGFGRLLTQMTNKPLRSVTGSPDPPAPTMADIPILRALAVRYPGSTESEKRFYERLGELERKRNTERADQRGQITGAVTLTPSERAEFNRLNTANLTVQSFRRRQRSIIADDRLSPTEKRSAVDALDLRILERMRNANR